MKKVVAKKAVKPMAASSKSGTSNVDKLHAAGVLEKGDVQPKHAKVINESMTDDEIKALISARKKLGLEDFKTDDGCGF